MQAAPIDFDPQEFLQPDIGKPNVAAKMIQ
jgi:hypothetical protein